MPKCEIGWVTDVGQLREHNEDAVLVMFAGQEGDLSLPSFGLLLLADGMGGHQSGELASSLAVRMTAYHVIRQSYLSSLLDRQRGATQPALTEILVNAVREANRAVSERAPGSGTTLTCALTVGAQAYIAHVGDSRAYLMCEDGLDQITEDHSVVHRLMDMGQITDVEAAMHPQRNVLYRAVGQSNLLEVDTHVRSVRSGHHLLLCSDGLWGAIPESDVVDLVKGASSLQEACLDMVAAANEAGGRDNISAILWRSPPQPE